MELVRRFYIGLAHRGRNGSLTQVEVTDADIDGDVLVTFYDDEEYSKYMSRDAARVLATALLEAAAK